MTAACLFLVFTVAALAGSIRAEETPSPAISAAPSAEPSRTATPLMSPTGAESTPLSPTRVKPLRISFLPPPLEGTISLGIYDAKGRLVRVLKREAALDDFTVGTDALSTTWDGKDNSGQPLPAGKYSARGFAVGDLQVEGVAFLLNDWIVEETSPRIQRVENLAVDADDALMLWATVNNGKQRMLALSPENGAIRADANAHDDAIFSAERQKVRVVEGKISVLENGQWRTRDWPSLVKPEAAALGKSGTLWVIDHPDRAASATELRQYSATGEILRHLAVEPSAPNPKLVAASTTSDRIYLLEKNASVQRLRGLTLVETKPAAESKDAVPVSEWKVTFSKTITTRRDAETLANALPTGSAGKPAFEPVTIKLRPNPLTPDAAAKLEVSAGWDSAGSFLCTRDGLPLQTVGQTTHAAQVFLARRPDGKSVDLFQDDGAVAEEFRVSNLDQMMAFDAGEVELK